VLIQSLALDYPKRATSDGVSIRGCVMNSKQKGKRGELEAVKALNDIGHDTRRTAQYSGADGQIGDIAGIDGIHVECKWVEALNPYKAFHQACRDCHDSDTPIVMTKRSREQWLLFVALVDATEFAKRWLVSLGYTVSANAETHANSESVSVQKGCDDE
jgi:hypothetical protein